MKTIQRSDLVVALATRLLVFVAAALLPAYCSAQIPSGPVPNGIGVNGGGEVIPVMPQVYGAGLRYLRTDLKWTTVEQSSGVYDFTAYDGLVSSAAQAGIRILFILDYANPLYDGGYSPYDDVGRTAFANYATAAVARYHGQGIIWEIYNEPQNFWTTPGTPSIGVHTAPEYAALAYATAKAIKTAYPNETVVGPAVTSIDSLLHSQFQNMKTILVALFETGACSYLDAISVHPYRKTGTSPETVSNDYPQIRQAMAPYSDCANLPIISSEWGVTSAQYFPPTGTLTVAQAEQLKAEYDARILLVNMMNGIPLSILYSWEDGLHPATNSGDNYGLVAHYDATVPNPTIAPLPAYNAVQTLTSQLSGYWYSSRISTGDPTDYILLFTNGTKTQSRYVCWNSAGTANTVNIPIGVNLGGNVPITVTNFDGSSVLQTISGPTGYACTEGDGPQYISLQSQ